MALFVELHELTDATAERITDAHVKDVAVHGGRKGERVVTTL